MHCSTKLASMRDRNQFTGSSLVFRGEEEGGGSKRQMDARGTASDSDTDINRHIDTDTDTDTDTDL